VLAEGRADREHHGLHADEDRGDGRREGGGDQDQDEHASGDPAAKRGPRTSTTVGIDPLPPGSPPHRRAMRYHRMD